MFAAGKTSSGAAAGAYQISRSLRFNRPDTAYLNRTPASSGNQQTWTYSTWIKRGSLDTNQFFFSQQTGSSDTGYFGIFLTTGNTLSCQGWISTWRVTTQVFRDVSAWYHIVVAVDTTQATANNRIRIYVNGSEVTSFTTTTNPTQNANTGVNGTGAAYVGKEYNSSGYFDGYTTETYLIDGQALTPSSFGQTNAQTGVWEPIAYSGSYGTNGFYLNFSDNSNTTAATLGKDYSGNGNNWTPNNFSVTAGVGNDSFVDSPTSYGVDTGAGGEVRGNYCTLNPLAKDTSVTASNGNLVATNFVTNRGIASTIYVSTGKWYAEFTCNANGTEDAVGIMQSPLEFSGTFYQPYQLIVIRNSAFVFYSSSANIGAPTWVSGDIIQVKLDLDNQTVGWAKNGGSFVTINITSYDSHVAGQLWTFGVKNGAAGGSGTFDYTVNFGQRPFAYTAPSGFKALCTQNLPTPTIGATSSTLATQFFAPVTYTGNNSTQSITNVGFQPDFVWIKYRTASASSNTLVNAVTGNTKYLFSNSSSAEETVSDAVTSFNSNGFSLGANNTGVLPFVNYGLGSYVAWNWKASNATAVTNTAGSLTSQVSANTTAGFSVLTYTGNAAAAQTIGHGLGVAPSMIIVKGRTGGTWPVYHKSLGLDQYVFLNSTAAANTVTGYWGTTNPSSTVFGVIGGGYGNNSGTAVGYCFAPIEGYSAFGSYTGNGSTDGTFVYLGFRPAYMMIKSINSVDNWVIMDVARNPSNAVNFWLNAENDAAEATLVPPQFDFVSNGMKLRGTSSSSNGSGVTYIYAAFASNPFKYSLAR